MRENIEPIERDSVRLITALYYLQPLFVRYQLKNSHFITSVY